MKRRIGLIVNPIAGMGGAVALKGTDGELAARAIELGATPASNDRTAKALAASTLADDQIEWLTVAGAIGNRSGGLMAESGNAAVGRTTGKTEAVIHAGVTADVMATSTIEERASGGGSGGIGSAK